MWHCVDDKFRRKTERIIRHKVVDKIKQEIQNVNCKKRENLMQKFKSASE